MNPTVFMALFFLAAAGPLSASQVLLSVHDTDRKPVPRAEAEIYFQDLRPQPPFTGTTDTLGELKAEGQSFFGFRINVKKAGHYSASWLIAPAVDRLERIVILPETRNPIPLYAREVGRGSNTDGVFPAENEWLDYDLELGDWVAPHGRGRVSDLRFRYQHEFQGYRYTPSRLEEEIRISKEIAARDRVEWTEEKFKRRHGRWAGEMEVSFVGEKEGMVEVSDRYLPYSQMKMPHEAPAEGYGPGRKYALNNYSPSGHRQDVGFFLRTRVKLDERGNIVSANYSKVFHDFRFWAEGQVEFTYYFNPTPNDRNLEFDPQRNLFPKSPQTELIRDP